MPATQLVSFSSHRLLAPTLLTLISGWAMAEDAPAPVAPAPSATSEVKPATDGTADKVTVKGEREDDYKVDQLSSVTRTPLSLKDTPQTVQVIPKELLRANGSASLQDAMRSVPGAALGSGEGSSTGDRIYLRGFLVNNDIYVDGMHDPALYLRDTFSADAIEVFKGPSSVLFGRGSPGGAINYVTKKPSDTWTGDGALTYGSYDNVRATAGVGGPLVKDGLLDMRLDGMVQDSNSFRDDVYMNRWGIAPSLSSRIGDFDVLVQYFHQEEDSMYDPGVGTFRGHPTDVSITKFYGFEDDDYQKYDVDMYTATVGYRFNENWSVRDQIRYSDYTRDMRITTIGNPANVGQQTNMPRNQALRLNELDNLDNILEAKYLGKVAGRSLSVVVGFEYVRETSDQKSKASTTVPTINVFDPDSSPSTVGAGLATDFSGPTATHTVATADTFAPYVFATYEVIDRLTLMAGVRYDTFKTELDDRAATNVDLDKTDEYFNTHLGVVYGITNDISVYASYGTAVNPSAESLALSVNSAELDPERTRSYEVGVKAETPDKTLGATLSVFRTDKFEARTGPNGAQTVDGQVQVDGLEAGLTGRPIERLSLYAGVAVLKGEVIESKSTANKVNQTADPFVASPVEGNEPVATPRLSGSIWANFDIGWGFSVGAGMYAVSQRYGDQVESQVIPGYARFDAALAYHHHFGEYTGFAQLNVFNLGDTTYYDGDRNRFITPGAPLSGQLTVGLDF